MNRPLNLENTSFGAPDMNAGFPKSMSDGLDRLPQEVGHTRPDPCAVQYEQPNFVPALRRLEKLQTESGEREKEMASLCKEVTDDIHI